MIIPIIIERQPNITNCSSNYISERTELLFVKLASIGLVLIKYFYSIDPFNIDVSKVNRFNNPRSRRFVIGVLFERTRNICFFKQTTDCKSAVAVLLGFINPSSLYYKDFPIPQFAQFFVVYKLLSTARCSAYVSRLRRC